MSTTHRQDIRDAHYIGSRNANEKYVQGIGWVFDEDKARADFERATVTDGVPRWNSNNQIPPIDMMLDWDELGLPIDIDAAVAAYRADSQAFFARYREQEANRVMTDEERFELRAAFGPNATVVNVVTGRKYHTGR